MTTQSNNGAGWRRVLGLLLVLCLALAACGSGDDDAGGDDESATASDSEATDEPADEEDADSSAEDGDDTSDSDDAASGESDDDETGEAADGDTFRVAVVAPSTADDLSWSQALADGLSALEESQGLEIAYSENMFVVEDAGAAIRDYADQGYDLVIAHGTQYGGSIETIAPEFPEVSFAYGTSTDTLGLDNVYAYTAEAEEGGYVNGVMAAAIAGDGSIGVVGPLEAGDAKLYVDGFLEGAAAGDGDATATYTGSFSDVALASEAAQAFVGNGATVLTGTSQSVVGAITVASDNDIPFFATQSDGTQLAPELIVASHVYRFDVVFDEMITNIKGGTLGGESYALNYGNGGFELVFNDGYAIDPEVKALGEEAVEAIIAGDIDPTVSTG